ncbi:MULTISPECIES: MBL fold metallo-hydrolase [Streptomyces]|uniref:MBL fold metallo-hydrolase n=1 Tax=Streptomyces doudnae TaxID=3075536 RepID=A0ABD5EHA0_9ACTN|nr:MULTISPECIES: MBL fold metallo-hydrolase [unclassified Streptomyces]MDT0433668.1 MBL fold metallo-hydrolase [Streptomyces sp. DSM 41981]MYQ68364.1 MBL fold metallo-hydrolase [Streptomyces sp. SID4950]SCE45520.1 Glyoxylase, beta-lactamase superfamily II [Streptomyces sp. SolWspMP-5a-2]
MRVHHLDCGTMRLPGARLVCHVLAVETRTGLLLVDTGYGTRDIAEPGRRIGAMRHLVRPALDPRETALHQITELGFRAEDVTHIVATHFDLDHIGGLADFPGARVHVTAAEARGALSPATFLERGRYRRPQLAHRPRLVEHEPTGERWRGFAAARQLTEIDDGVVLLSVPGHTRGHAAVAIDAGDHWVLHCGDAFYHPGTLDGSSPVPWALRAQERLVAHDIAALRANQARIAALRASDAQDLMVVCSHDPGLLAAARARAAGGGEAA